MSKVFWTIWWAVCGAHELYRFFVPHALSANHDAISHANLTAACVFMVVWTALKEDR